VLSADVADAIASGAPDSLAMLGAADLAADSDLDRALAVIHIDHDVLSGEAPGNATTETGGTISAEVARRMCCDGWIQYVAEDGADNDRPVGVGRKTRIIPRWLRRIVRHRDRRCRCCGGPIHHIHHIVFWGMLGRTDEDSLVGVCWGCQPPPAGRHPAPAPTQPTPVSTPTRTVPVLTDASGARTAGTQR
jgi:hypothetical protein